jgi:hypothetical protein
VTKRNKTAKDTRHNHDHPNTYEITFQGKTHRIEIKASTLSLLNSSDPDLYARGVDQEPGTPRLAVFETWDVCSPREFDSH